jgi:hypothetical protein
MRTLIRDVKTQMFCGSDGQWTAERDDARDFGGTFQAMSFAGEHHLHGVQIVLVFEIPEYDVVINFERDQQPPGTFREGTGSGNDS